jgi:quinoprotein glucose dehydrogenase
MSLYEKLGAGVLLSRWKVIVLLMFCIGCKKMFKQNVGKDLPTTVSDQHRTWKDFGGGPDHSKYVALDQINASNVSQLQVAWFYPTGDDNAYQFNPVIVDSVMYVLARNNSLIALNASTGKEIWIHANLRGIARRGINYWESRDKKDQRLLFQMNDYLQAIDARTGKSILTFGDNGLVDLKAGLGRDPNTIARVQSGTPGKVFENLLLLGSAGGENYFAAPGHLRAYNVVTGKLEWIFHTIPHPGEYGYDTWPKDAYQYAGGVNTWGEISVDEKRGIAYFPLGSPTYDYYGADRIGSNLYGNCLLALDARTGKRLWHFQLVHHDLWDYDASAAPQLVTVTHKGRKIDAVAQAGKTGFLYAFNRVTGEPLWPIEERPVPPSEVPGEQAWPTQPFPTVLPPFARQGMTSKDITPYFLTSEERTAWIKRIDTMATGLFTPLSHKRETLALPGAVGGASWGNTAAIPNKGIVYVMSIDWPSFYEKLEKREAHVGEAAAAVSLTKGGSKLYAQNCQACHGADRAGAAGPTLIGLEKRLSFKDFQQVVVTGRGKMPAFQHIDEATLKSLYQFLGGSPSGLKKEDDQVMPPGPVVATGGAPGGLEVRLATGAPIEAAMFDAKEFGSPYPEGTTAPAVRYYTQGWGLNQPYLISPPWSSITAYDLNKGEIKWKIPLGQDQDAAAEGGKNTGVPRAQRNGMITTSSGLIFSTAKDGHVYAFDANTGTLLWAGKLPMGTEGLPAMYEVHGRSYLVVSATTPLVWGRGRKKNNAEDKTPKYQGGYVVYTLPEWIK